MEKLIILKRDSFTMKSATKLMESLDVCDQIDEALDFSLFLELTAISDGDKCDYVLGNTGDKIVLHIVYGGYGMFKSVEIPFSGGQFMKAGIDAMGLLHIFVVKNEEIWYVKQLSESSYNFTQPVKVSYTRPLHFAGIKNLIIHNFSRDSGLGFALGVISQTVDSKAFWLSYRHWNGSLFDSLIPSSFLSSNLVFSGSSINDLSVETVSTGYASYSIPRSQVEKSYCLSLPLKTDKVKQVLTVNKGVLLALVDSGNDNCAVVDIRLDDTNKTATAVALTPRNRYSAVAVYHGGDDKAVLVLNGDRLYSTILTRSNGCYSAEELFPLDETCFAPCFNSNSKCMRLYYLTQERNVVHQLENRGGATWVENTIQPPKPDEIRRLPCYSTELAFSDSVYGTPLADMEVEIWAESRTYVETTDSIFMVDEDTKAKVRTDNMGKVILLQYTSSLDVPAIYASLPQQYLEADQAIVISQFAGVRERLSSVDAEQLLSAEQVDSMAGTRKPFMPDEYRKQSTAEELANGIQEIMKIKPQNIKSATISGIDSLKNLNCIEQTDNLPIWSMDFESGQPVFARLTHEEAENERKMMFKRANGSATVPKWLQSIANFFRSIVKGFISLCKIIIDKLRATFEFIIDGIRMVLDVIIKVVQEVLHVVEILLSKLAIVFLVVFAWLASLFMWDDVMRTKRAIREMMLIALDSLPKSIADLKNKFAEQLQIISKDVDKMFDGLIGQFDPSKQIGDYKNEKVSPENPEVSYQMSNDPLQKKFSNPSVIHCSLSGFGNLTIEQEESPIDEVVKILNSFVAEMDDAPEFQEALRYFENIFSGGVENFFTSLVAGLLSAIRGVTRLVLSSISKITSALFDIMELLLDKVKVLLTETIQIPFFTSFYRSITGDQLTMLDLTAMLMAFPMTLVHKLLEGGRAPLKDDAELGLFIDQVRSTFQSNDIMRKTEPPTLTSVIASYFCFISGTIYYGLTSVLDAMEDYDSPMLTWLAIGFELVWFVSSCPSFYKIEEVVYTWFMWSYFCFGCALDITMTIINKRYIDVNKTGRCLTGVYGLGHLAVSIAGRTTKALTDTELTSEIFSSVCEISKPLGNARPPIPPTPPATISVPVNAKHWSTIVIIVFDAMAAVAVLTCGIIDMTTSDQENGTSNKLLLS